MKRKASDIFLNIALVTMFAAAVFQTALLWTGSTKTAASAENRDAVIDRAAVTEELFQPYRLYVSDGSGLGKGELNKADAGYSMIWSELQLFIKDIYAAKTETMDRSMWELIKTGKGVIAEFRLNIPTDILEWFLGGVNLPDNGIDGVTGIMISIGSIQSKPVLYLLDGAEIHKVTLAYRNLGKEVYESVIVNAGRPGSEADYPKLAYADPAELSFAPDSDNLRIRAVAEALLAGEKYSYEMDVGGDGTLIMANFNSIYYLDRHGFLEYEYKSAQSDPAAKGTIAEAFVKALGFIYGNGRRNLTTKAGLYLTGIEENENEYVFMFDYIVRSDRTTPIYVDYIAGRTTEGGRLLHSITVAATGAGTVRAYWLMKQFTAKENVKIKTAITLADIDALAGAEAASMTDASIGYMISSEDPGYAESGIEPGIVLTLGLPAARYLYRK